MTGLRVLALERRREQRGGGSRYSEEVEAVFRRMRRQERTQKELLDAFARVVEAVGEPGFARFVEAWGGPEGAVYRLAQVTTIRPALGSRLDH